MTMIFDIKIILIREVKLIGFKIIFSVRVKVTWQVDFLIKKLIINNYLLTLTNKYL